MDEHHIFLYGGGLAFSLFVCIVPFLLILISVLGSILEFSSVKDQIMTFIDTVVPYEEYASYAKEIVFSRIQEVVEYKSAAGYIGAFGLFFAASGLFSSMRTILNKVFTYHKREEKSAIIGKLRDFAMVIIIIVLVMISTFLLPAIDIIKNYTINIPFLSFIKLGVLEHLMISSVSFLIIFITFLTFYSLIPYTMLGNKVKSVSALSAALLWELAKRAFGYYIGHISSMNKIYGTYALLVVLGFWVYYSCIIFIIGAEIGQLFRERVEKSADDSDKDKIMPESLS